MPLFQLTEKPLFPPIDLATQDGLLAVGGDLSRERLLLAYKQGIFPWYSVGDPILWWSPDPRMVLFPDDFVASRSLKRTARSGRFRFTLDTAFDDVIFTCAKLPRGGQEGTWITREMMQAYVELHRAGYAHSVECWSGDDLVGGLYGVSLGRCFFGESMFSKQSNMSKLALYALVEQLKRWNFSLIDCQLHTPHLESLGAQSVSRDDFRRMLAAGVHADTRLGPWRFDKDILKV